VRKLALVVVTLVTLVLLSSCRIISQIGVDHDQLSRERMTAIVDAVNAQDAAALKAMFTQAAVAGYSTELDDGLARLLALFPNGDVAWQRSGGTAHPLEWANYGAWTTLLESNYSVTSGGLDYSLFFADFIENDNDPDNVGLYGIGAVLQSEDGNTSPEAALFSWMGTFDVHASNPPGVIVAESAPSSRDRMTQIVNAMNVQDSAALKAMFTQAALAEHSAEIDSGLDYLLSLFPNGDLTWQPEEGGSIVLERVDGGGRAVLRPSFYSVSSGGVTYRFFFADFTENTINADQVGIQAIGAIVQAERMNFVPEDELTRWTRTFEVAAGGHSEVFIPVEHSADERIEQIVAALNAQDPSALRQLFSPYALENSVDIDAGVDYLLSVFPSGELSWSDDTVAPFQLDSSAETRAGSKSEILRCNYKISAGGRDFWLYFSEYRVNELADGDWTGLFKLGVTEWTEDREEGFGGELARWASASGSGPNSEDALPGIYIPK
jgi:hypothetical protein